MFHFDIRTKHTALNLHLGILVLLFAVTGISHYHELLENVPVISQISTSVLFGLERHALDRLIYCLIIAYAGWVLGVKVGVTVLLACSLAMFPRVFFISPFPKDALLETFTAILIGGLVSLFIRVSRSMQQQRDELQVAMTNLRMSEENYRDLFENASDAIWIHDLEGNITAANRATEKMTGYPIDELLGKNVTEFLSEDAIVLARIIKGKLLNGEPIEERYEQRLFRRDRTEAIVELTTRLITQNSEPMAFQNNARDVTEERKMRDSMRFYLQKVLAAQEEERKRIARELHDDAAQSLLLLMRRLDAIASDPRNKLSKPVEEKLAQVNRLAVETLDGLRRYAQELRPAILDDMGLVAALEWMADNLTTEESKADVQLDMQRRDLPREIELVLFRIAQEALSNIKRHAEASKVVIGLESGPRQIKMIITDNGKGFEVPQRLSDLSRTGKLGLIGMQERVQLLRGTTSIQSELGKGTTITVEIPLEE